MKTLITGGYTEVPIDKIRSITNIFKGRTALALTRALATSRNKKVDLITNSNVVDELYRDDYICYDYYKTFVYRTYDELYVLMERMIRENRYDVIIHSAAVSDYKVEAVLDNNLVELDNTGKISSDHDVLYMRLVKTEKIIDKIREWGFKGTLVKFKLQVGISDEELIKIAEKSRVASGADIIVANCLEWAKDRAIILADGINQPTSRVQLPMNLEKVIKKVRR
jgi:phosphopantothenoylcysteine synthetase/decarboxylase